MLKENCFKANISILNPYNHQITGDLLVKAIMIVIRRIQRTYLFQEGARRVIFYKEAKKCTILYKAIYN